MPTVDVVSGALDRLSARLREGPLPPAPDFVYGRDTPFYPPLGAPWAAPFFFAAVLHLYGFWDEDGRRFTGPVRGFIDGREYAGDDYLWKALWRSAQEEPKFPLASFQASM